MVPVELKDAEGKSAGTWYFPVALQVREICADAGCNDVCGDTGSAFFFTE